MSKQTPKILHLFCMSASQATTWQLSTLWVKSTDYRFGKHDFFEFGDISYVSNLIGVWLSLELDSARKYDKKGVRSYVLRNSYIMVQIRQASRSITPSQHYC